MNVQQRIREGVYENKLGPANARNSEESHRQRMAWRAEESRLLDLLRADLEEEFYMATHNKRQKLWDKAWEHGHSDGFAQVYYHYEDLHELIDYPASAS